jgi:hypothetical protein
MIRAIVAVASGAGEVPSDLVARLLTQLGRLQRHVLIPRGLTLSGLTERETEVFRTVAEGMDTAEIARALSYSERTVKTSCAPSRHACSCATAHTRSPTWFGRDSSEAGRHHRRAGARHRFRAVVGSYPGRRPCDPARQRHEPFLLVLVIAEARMRKARTHAWRFIE